jgi:hypothetical protein
MPGVDHGCPAQALPLGVAAEFGDEMSSLLVWPPPLLHAPISKMVATAGRM